MQTPFLVRIEECPVLNKSNIINNIQNPQSEITPLVVGFFVSVWWISIKKTSFLLLVLCSNNHTTITFIKNHREFKN